MAKGNMPSIVFIGPPKRRAKFRYVLFQINEKDADGVPTKLSMFRDEDQAIDISGGEEFMTAYVPAQMLEKE